MVTPPPAAATEGLQGLVRTLRERAKELACLYRVEELLRDPDVPLDQVFHGVMEALPDGLQFSDLAQVSIVYGGRSYEPEAYIADSPWGYCAEIRVRDDRVGQICFAYTSECPGAFVGPFLEEEIRLIRTIADRLGEFLLYRRLRQAFEGMGRGSRGGQLGGAEDARAREAGVAVPPWRIALDLLRRTDRRLTSRVARKMMNHLMWRGIAEAQPLLQRSSERLSDGGEPQGESNQPLLRKSPAGLLALCDETFELAGAHLDQETILALLHKWVNEDRSTALVRPLVDASSSLGPVSDGITRFAHVVAHEGVELSQAARASVRVSLIRRFLTEQLELVQVAKGIVELEDFFSLPDRIIHTTGSAGRLGGKGAGLFLAECILRRAARRHPQIGDIRVPRTWYIASDAVLAFVRENDIEDVYEQKYKTVDAVRQDYPQLVQVFKNSRFPAELVKAVGLALDDLGPVPLIVRSSSLLEDRLGSAFSGKYKSLFLANQGSRAQRLDALLDAVAEVYASTFGPDAIEYRARRGLLDFNEEMGILIQAVVGTRVGRYWMPSFAGVAFSRNELRWSPRIQRSDGLLRMVPGLGTRAVDRLSDDYPVLIAPGQPGLRVNVTLEETLRYAPRYLDAIDLERGTFETLEVAELVRSRGADIPMLSRLVSLLEGGRLVRPMGMATDWSQAKPVVTFGGLLQDTDFIARMAAILHELEQSLDTPVDVEFASDGRCLYLLQCRPQSQHGSEAAPAVIPDDVDPGRVLFTARRYVSNGAVPDLTHIVYVDPDRYAALPSHDALRSVGRCVASLNSMLPRRSFTLIGPGRWGSRGDIRLGVRVTYADIDNTALLMEVARRRGSYVPDLSFGTHFFQDLVEADIRYLPLYPDDGGVHFDEDFLLGAPNQLPELLPEFAGLADVVRVIDVPATRGGLVLRVLLNAEEERAMGLLCAPDTPRQDAARPAAGLHAPQPATAGDHWRWRQRMAERIAADLDAQRFGVQGLYLFGSTKNATAGPASDIDLLVHVRGTEQQQEALLLWLDGWSRSLAQLNEERTGQRSDGLLDLHLVTDADIEARTSWAVKIGAVTDAARPLRLGAPS